MTHNKLLFQLFLLTSLALAAADTQFLKPRLEKSLVNTFPFNANEEDHGDHHDHHDHHEHHEHHDDGKTSSVGVHALLARQYPSGEVPPEEPGKKCVQKENLTISYPKLFLKPSHSESSDFTVTLSI